MADISQEEAQGPQGRAKEADYSTTHQKRRGAQHQASTRRYPSPLAPPGSS